MDRTTEQYVVESESRMIIGFTGTSRGMNAFQCKTLARKLLQRFPAPSFPSRAHHGLCVGGDEQFHEIIRELFPRTRIIGHPGFPEDSPFRSKVICDEIRDIPALGRLKPPIQRNHDIVDEVHFIYVGPQTVGEMLRSGTWSTYRYAKSIGREYEIIWPIAKFES